MNSFKKLFLFLFLVLFITSCKHTNQPHTRGITLSSDNIPISYSVYGQGKITLLFVHGWSCDSRYWYKQISSFSKKYRIVTIDLAGHGHSGYARKDYTMPLFGDDVKSVIETLDAENVILIGHSMGYLLSQKLL